MTSPDKDPVAPPPSHPGSNFSAPRPVVEHGHIGAVRAFRADHHDEPFSATLSFRIGEADERLGTHGRCHLLERLVKPDSTPDGVAVNSEVTTLRTRFTVTGPDEAAGEVLTNIARAIATLRTDRVDEVIPELLGSWHPLERWDTTLMALRFGSRGYGLSAFPLLGLKYPDIAAFTDWAHTWFNAPNAVVSANRPIPSTLDLSALGDGSHKVLPEPHQVARPYPVIADGPEGMVALSFLTVFDAGSELAIELLLARLAERCAAIDPGINRPTMVTRHTGASLATVGIAVRAPAELLVDIRDSISAELFGFGINGPTAEEFDQARVTLRRTRSPGSGRGVDRQAKAALFDEPYDPDAMPGTTPADLARAVRNLGSTLIWLLPRGVRIADHRLVRVVHGSAPVTEGETYQTSPGTTDPNGPIRLIAGARGITVQHVDGSLVTVAFNDAVALEHLPDGGRVLWGDDGTRIRLDPNSWPGGDRLAGWLDQCVDPWVILGRAPDTATPPSPPSG